MNSIIRHACRAALVLGALAAAGRVQAADTDQAADTEHAPDSDLAADTDPDNPSDNTVTTVADGQRSVADARFPSGFVTRIDVSDELGHGRDLGDSLAKVAGVDVARNAGFGRPAFASVRGGNSRQLAVSLNGMRLSAPAGLGFDIGSLSLAGIDSVDVYRGSAATVAGAGALSGAVNLRTRLARGRGVRASATSLVGSHRTYVAAGQLAAATDGYAVRVGGRWRQSRGDFGFVDAQGQSHRRLNNDHDQFGVHAAGRIDVGDGRLTPLVTYEQGDGGAPGPSEFQAQFADARLAKSRLVGQLNWQQKAVASGDWGAVDLRAMGGYQRRVLDYTNPDAFPGTTAVSDHSTLQSVELHTGADAWLAAGNLVHLQLEARGQTYGSTHRSTEPDQPSEPGRTQSTRLEAARRSFAAAISDELLVLDASVSLVAGLRVQSISDTPRAGRRGGQPKHWTPLIPSAGVIWRARRWLHVQANIARTFRAPDFDELYLAMVGVRGNPQLAPESALTWDAGVRLGSDDDIISAETVYFHNAIDQSIYFVARTAYLFEAANLGSGASQGLEATVRLTPHERVDAQASYTLTDATLDALAADVPMPGQPRHQIAARAHVDLGGLGPAKSIPSIRLGGAVRWQSRVYLDSFANISNPPRWTVDASAAVSAFDWLDVTVTARNLTDNRRRSDALQRPLPGRTIYASVSVEFGAIQ